MQGGRTLHYHGNTVEHPRPSRKNRERRIFRGAAQEHPDKIMADEPRVCAMLRCVWCGVDFEDYRIACHRCQCCQYCGMIVSSPNACHTCNNYLPDELKPKEPPRRIIVA